MKMDLRHLQVAEKRVSAAAFANALHRVRRIYDVFPFLHTFFSNEVKQQGCIPVQTECRHFLIALARQRLTISLPVKSR